MSKINLLDKKVYNRIAAGEVVERPYSVVKELVENSIDAKSTEISVSIFNGGIERIQVSDNGVGIEFDDLKNAMLPHATSKILNVDDLDKILTLGFRGEALASISSVAKVTIVSKPKNQENGGKIYAEGGQIFDAEQYPSENGTTITVDNLFYNTPARAKFLKPAKSEEGDITNIISRLILANPTVAIKYSVDGKVVLQSYGDGLKNALISVYGVEAYNNCFEISTEKNGIKIFGYIGKHFYTKPNRTYQTLILNGRYIVNATTSSAVQNAYGSYLMKRQYPFYVLSIQLDSEFVDVNVHPSKTDVRFVNNQIVYGALYSVISKVLDGSSQAIDIVVDNHESRPIENKPENVNQNVTKILETSNYFPKDYVDKKSHYEYESSKFDDKFFMYDSNYQTEKSSSRNKPEVDIFAENKAYIEKLKQEELSKTVQTELTVSESLKYVGHALNTYIILERGEDVFFIDQHAAHERLLYDKLVDGRNNAKLAIQTLLMPFTVDLNPNEFELVSAKLDYIRELGFEIQDVGMCSFSITAIPYELLDMDFKMFFDDLIGDSVFIGETTPQIIKEKLMQKACKSAIKAGYNLSQSEIDALIEKLNGNLGLKCPHGRPIACRITRTEIDKWFKRIV